MIQFFSNLARAPIARTAIAWPKCRRHQDKGLNREGARDQVKADRRYAGGLVVVCAVVFEPIAGHRSDSKLVKFLAHDREIELWLAPIADARVVAPVRLSLANMLGNLVLQAKSSRPPGGAPRWTRLRALIESRK
jgi:hypothetical protein